jgi:hypothetical protein
MDGRGFSRVTRRKGKKTSCARPQAFENRDGGAELGIKKPGRRSRRRFLWFYEAFCSLFLIVLSDSGGFADAVAQVIELGAPDFSLANDWMLSIRGEWTGKVLSTPTLWAMRRTVNVSRTDRSSGRLRCPRKPVFVPVALDDLHVDADGISDFETRDFVASCSFPAFEYQSWNFPPSLIGVHARNARFGQRTAGFQERSLV